MSFSHEKTFVTLAVLLLILLLHGTLLAAPEAICVPAAIGVNLPHAIYLNAETTVKGIARGDATHFKWDFGDGNTTDWIEITDPFNLGVRHIYSGFIGQEYMAILYVKNEPTMETSSDNYAIKLYEYSDPGKQSHMDIRIKMAIDEGLWWLHTHLVRNEYGAGSPGYGQKYGYWNDPSGYPLAATGAALTAFEVHGSRPNGDYANDPYVETVIRSINYVLYNTYRFDIGAQTAGDPDTNQNGIGLIANQSGNVTDSRQTYIGGICMIALANSKAPNVIAAVGNDSVVNRTLKDIVQDMVDFFAWGQSEASTGIYRGGWRYFANYGQSDMSTTQWPVLGITAAEENMGPPNSDVRTPGFVRTELAYYLDAMQNDALDNDNGGFSYNGGTHYYNCAKQGAGLIGLIFIGKLQSDPAILSTIGYLYRHWNDTGGSWDDTQIHGNSYSMYTIMKGFRLPEPDIERVMEYDYNQGMVTGNSFDWYYSVIAQTQKGIASYLIETQQADGSWDDTIGSNRVYDALCTGWRIATLEKGVTSMKPVSYICDCERLEFDLLQPFELSSCSYHPDPKRKIVLYEWDVDFDGTTFKTDYSGPQVLIENGFPIEGYHPVALRVTDDTPGMPQTEITICSIFIHPPPHCPFAEAGGPYIGYPNKPVVFDASGSYDPNEDQLIYDWDFDNDGIFGAEDDDCFSQPSDGVGISPSFIWNEPYSGNIGLRVTDMPSDPNFDACFSNDSAGLIIGNHEPVCKICKDMYSGTKGETIQILGICSNDPDGRRHLKYEWDTNDDGLFDDGNEPILNLLIDDNKCGGDIFSVGLKVTDSQGLYSVCYTNVKVAGKIVFASNRDGNEEIYIMSSDGKDQKNLSNNVYEDGTPSISSDENHVFFASNRDGNWEIYRMDISGSNQVNLTNSPSDDGWPSISPDGKKVLFISDRNDQTRHLYIMASDGTNVEEIAENYVIAHAAWSPNGDRIVFSSDNPGNRELFVYNVSTKEIARFTNNSDYDDYPVWSPDNKYICFASDRDSNNSSKLDLFLLDVEQSHSVIRLTDSKSDERYPAWSIDGRLVFCKGMTYDLNWFDIFITESPITFADQNEIKIKKLTHNAVNDNHPSMASSRK